MNEHDATEVAYKNGYQQAKAGVAREIFAEIEALFPCDKKFTIINRFTINQLKKKYTEGQNE